MFTHESNLIVPGTNHRLGAAHATEIWYRFNNVDVDGPKHPKEPSRPGLIGTDPDREKTAPNMSEMWPRSLELVKRGQGSTAVAGLYLARARYDDDRCAMQGRR